MSQPHPLDGLLEEMLPKAGQLVVYVRDHDIQAVAELVEPLGVMQLRALLLDVAAMVPDDATQDELLAWTHGPQVGPEQYAELVEGYFGPDARPCCACGVPKAPEEFHVDQSKPHGRSYRCKTCVSSRDRQAREAAA